jgi:hypothetical protein
MNDINRSTTATRQHPGRSLLFLGMFLVVGSYALSMVLMLGAKILRESWYAPILGTLGVALIILALMRSRSIWRWIAVVVFTLFVAFQWWAGFAMRLPAYTGPVKGGQTFPAFATTLADGSAFTQDDLKGDQNTVMVFFRGHW